MTSSKLLLPPSFQEAGTHTALAWFPMAMHTPVALHIVGWTLVSAWAMRPTSSQLGHLSLAAKGPQGHLGVLTSSPEWPLLPQASSSSWALPSRTTLVPEGDLVGEGSFLLPSSGTSVSSVPLLLRGADLQVTGPRGILTKMVKQCWGGGYGRYPEDPQAPALPCAPCCTLGVSEEFKCGGFGLKGRASVVQALAIGCGQLICIAV